MANELQTKLDAILEDKNTNLLPEHLKAGVTCLGVEGEFEGGAQINNQDITINKSGTYTADEGYTGLGTVVANFSGGDTKTFETVEDMYADENPIPDGKALIYRKQKSYIEQNTNFTDIWLPETITLPRAVTSDIQINVSIEHEHGGGGNSPTITSDGVTFMFHLNMSMAYFEYVSTDGITYTRTTADVSNEDMGWGDYFDWTDDVLSIKSDEEYSEGYHCSYAVTSGDEDLAKEFFTRMSYGFHGLYINASKRDDTKVQMVKNIQLDTHDSEELANWNMTYDSKYDMPLETISKITAAVRGVCSTAYNQLIEQISDTSYNFYGYTYNASNGSTYTQNCDPVCLYRIDGSSNCHVGYSWSTSNTSATLKGFVIYHVDISGTTPVVTDIKSSFTQKSISLSNTTIYYLEEAMDPTHYWTSPYYSGNQPNDLEPIIPPSSGNYSGYTSWHMSMDVGKSYEYQVAQTQFTLENKNELLDGVCALGKNGEITGDGSIYQHITYEQYMNNNGMDLREGIIYAATKDNINISNTPCETTNTSLQYMQCSKIEQPFDNYYLICDSLFRVWYCFATTTLKICNPDNTELYEYVIDSNTSISDQISIQNKVIDNALYICMGTNIYKITSTETTIVYNYSRSYFKAIFTDNGIYVTECSGASNKTVDVAKVSYGGTRTALTSWTRSAGDYYGDGRLVVYDNHIYITMNTTNSNYGYLGIINMENDSVTCSKSYSTQCWLMHDIHTGELLFGQYANSVTNVYKMSTDGTLTNYGTINTSLYNDDFNCGYFVPELNGIVGFGMFNGINSFVNSGNFNLAYLVSGNTEQDNWYLMLTDVTCENDVIKADMLYFNSALKLNYKCTYTIDISYSFIDTGVKVLLGINGDEHAGRYRKVNILPGAINTQYENTISPTEYEEINTIAEDVLGGVE